ncbi:MAG: hypothetical protein ACJAW3_000201 [Lentimonas sp.]|jgi:hypothetical protein
MLKVILQLVTVSILAQLMFACNYRIPSKEPSKFFKKSLESATPDFKQGWEDGCEVGMSGGSNSFYQSVYDSNKMDGYKYSYSTDYRIAWERAFWFCYRTDFVDQKSTPHSSIFGGVQ